MSTVPSHEAKKHAKTPSPLSVARMHLARAKENIAQLPDTSSAAIEAKRTLEELQAALAALCEEAANAESRWTWLADRVAKLSSPW